MVAEQVAHGDALGRDRIAQSEFGNVIADRLAPVETSLVDQQRQRRGGERLGDRADQKLRLGCRRQPGFNVALAPGLEENRLAVLHDRERDRGHLPLGHRLRRKCIELGREGGDCRVPRCRSVRHSRLFSVAVGCHAARLDKERDGCPLRCCDLRTCQSRNDPMLILLARPDDGEMC